MQKYGPRAKTIPEYRTWLDIKTRCFNPRRPQWKDYGGRGITMAAVWRDSFINFLRDMGPRPSGMTMIASTTTGTMNPEIVGGQPAQSRCGTAGMPAT